MSGRRLGAAVGVGVVLALLVDLLLQIALNAVRMTPSRENWQDVISSKGVWLVAVGIAAWVAPMLLDLARHRMAWVEAFRVAGAALVATPLIWTAATLALFAIRLTLTRAWGSEGQVFLHNNLYAELVITDGPWLLAGAGVRALASHVSLS